MSGEIAAYYEVWRMLISDCRAILRDEELFPNSFSFLPERYEVNVSPELAHLMDPDTWVFGFGRRRCPGVPFARSSVWLAMVCMLSCFRIERVHDKHGREVVPDRAVSGGAIQCAIFLKSWMQQNAHHLVHQAYTSVSVPHRSSP